MQTSLGRLLQQRPSCRASAGMRGKGAAAAPHPHFKEHMRHSGPNGQTPSRQGCLEATGSTLALPTSTLQQGTPPNSPAQLSLDDDCLHASSPLKAVTVTNAPARRGNTLVRLAAAILLCVLCVALPIPGILICLLLMGVVAIMESFWRSVFTAPRQSSQVTLPAHGQESDCSNSSTTSIAKAISAAEAPGLQSLAVPPAEVAGWLQTVNQDLWGGLWQPFLDFKEAWQEAMALHGPYAWTYETTTTNIGCLTPSLTGVQAFADPETGAVVAVEAEVYLNSHTAPESVVLEVQARGPIGKYSFNLTASSVRGRIRLVPVPQHGLLLVQYVEPPSVVTEVQIAYPRMLPHNRAKLQQVWTIRRLLQETLAGVLGTPDVVQLQHKAQPPVTPKVLTAVSDAAAWLIRSMAGCVSAWSKLMLHTPPLAEQCCPTPDSKQAKALDDPTAAQHARSAATQEPGGVGELRAPVADDGPEPAPAPAIRSAGAVSTAYEVASGAPSSSSSSSNNKTSTTRSAGAGWRLSSSISEAVECWSASGATARLSAGVAATAAGGASGTSTATSSALGMHGKVNAFSCLPHVLPHSPQSKNRQAQAGRTAQAAAHQDDAQQCSESYESGAISSSCPYVLVSATPSPASHSDSNSHLHPVVAGCDAGESSSTPSAPVTSSAIKVPCKPSAAAAARTINYSSTNSRQAASSQHSSSSSKSDRQPRVVAGPAAVASFRDAPTRSSRDAPAGAIAATAAAVALPPVHSNRPLLSFVASASAVLLGANLLLGWL